LDSKRVSLRWTGEDLRFEGGAEGGAPVVLDSSGEAGPSPMESLLLGVAGCMAIDVLMILRRSRVRVDALEIDAEGDRADSEPKRFVAIRLNYRVTGPGEGDRKKLQRAVDLSRDTYCSVLHTLRPDLDLDIRIEGV